MNILVDIAHPAHVHFFKYAIKLWKDHGHKVLITTRNVPTALRLLDAYNLKYEIVSQPKHGTIGLALELLTHTALLLPRMKKWDIDVCVSIGGTFTVFAGLFAGCRRIVFTDTETATTANKITFPFANYIVTPESYPHNLGNKHLRYKGFHELAYLHPDYFQPDPAILRKYDLTPADRYSIVRLSAWNAIHDIGANRMNTDQHLNFISKLKEYGKVLIIPEGATPGDLDEYLTAIAPEDFHNLIYYAQSCITEGATTAAEAAILGTPSIYISSLAPQITCEYAEYGSLSMLSQYNNLDTHVDLALRSEAKALARKAAGKIISDHINVSQFVAELIDPTIEPQKCLPPC